MLIQGKKITIPHQDHKYSYRVYIKFSAHVLKPTKILMEFSNILTYTNSDILVDRSGTNITETFILHWQEQFLLYENLVSGSDFFYEVQKSTI